MLGTFVLAIYTRKIICIFKEFIVLLKAKDNFSVCYDVGTKLKVYYKIKSSLSR